MKNVLFDRSKKLCKLPMVIIKDLLCCGVVCLLFTNTLFAQDTKFHCVNSDDELFLEGTYNELTESIEKLNIIDIDAVEIIKETQFSGKLIADISNKKSYLFKTHVPFDSKYGAVPPYRKFLGKWNTNKYSNINNEIKDRVVNVYINSRNIFTDQFRLVFEIAIQEEYTYEYSSEWDDGLGDYRSGTYKGIREIPLISKGLECFVL